MTADTVVEVWISWGAGYQAEMGKLTQMGHNIILAAPWYLDWITIGPDWRQFYAVEPLNFTGRHGE